MRITVSKLALEEGLAVVSKALAKSKADRSNNPQLANILITAVNPPSGKQAIKLRSSNGVLHITTWVRCDVAEIGSVSIPFDLVSAFLGRVADEDKLELSTDDRFITSIRVDGKRVNTSLNGLSHKDFPEEVKISSLKSGVQVSSADLRLAILQTAVAAASTKLDSPLCCTHMSVNGSRVLVAGCDSFRLCEKSVDVVDSDTASLNFELDFPASAAMLLASALPDDDTQVTINKTANDNLVVFKFGSTTVASNLFSKPYPVYESFIPKTHGVRAVISIAHLLKSIKAAAVFAKSDKNTLLVSFSPPEDKEVVLNAKADQQGAFEDFLPLESITGDNTLSFRSSIEFLVAAINSLSLGGCDKVALEIEAKFKIIMIRPLDKNGEQLPGYRYMVLPISTGSSQQEETVENSQAA